MNKQKIIPTIFSHNKKEFEEKLKKVLPITNKIQIDFMDGVFVENKSVEPRFVKNLKKHNKEFEAHLMVMEPRKYYNKIKNKGFKKIIFHIESFKSLQEIKKFFEEIKKEKIKPILAINPRTKLDELIIKNFEHFLLMGVQPGREKQKLKKSVYNKIRRIKKENPKAKIQIDGGVNPNNAEKLLETGADYLNSGSYISESKNPEEALSKLIKRR